MMPLFDVLVAEHFVKTTAWHSIVLQTALFKKTLYCALCCYCTLFRVYFHVYHVLYEFIRLSLKAIEWIKE